MIQGCYERKLLFCKHIMNTHEAFFRVQWQLRKLCGFLELPQTQRARLCKGKVGNPVTCWLVWMHLNDSAHLIRYKFMFVCTPLESELHSKDSPMLTLASPVEPRRRHPVHLHAALTLASPCSNWVTNINRKLFSIGNTVCTFTSNLLSESVFKLPTAHSAMSMSSLIKYPCEALLNILHNVLIFM